MSTYKQILVAVDLTEDSLSVCRKALEVAGENGANILLVHVLEFIYQMSTSYDPLFYPSFEELGIDEEELKKVADKKMLSLIKELALEEGRSLSHEIVSGVPKTEILCLAEEKQTDLIICGSHGRSGFELLLGSTANAILHHANCDVLAVRTRKKQNK